MRMFTPRETLQIDISNHYGLDKKSWDERLSWFQQNEHQLESLTQKAEEPALFYAGVKAWRQVQKGEPIGYCISFDATSSGAQLLSALVCDRSAASLCNVVSTGSREDLYARVYQAMLQVLGEEGQITRSQCKEAIMTSLYGSQAVPKEVFGDGPLYRLFIKTMKTLMPGAWELNEFFLEIWDENKFSYDWVLPDNFHVRSKVMNSVSETVHFNNAPYDVHRLVNAPIEKGRSLGANTIHSLDGMIVREMVRRCSYDPTKIAELKLILQGKFPAELYAISSEEDVRMVEILWDLYKKSGYLSARILDHLNIDNIDMVDATVIQELVDSLPEKPFQLFCVHDAFKCLPTYGNDVRRQYANQLYLIARSNLLSFLLSQLMGRDVQVGKLDPSMIEEIRESEYALS